MAKRGTRTCARCNLPAAKSSNLKLVDGLDTAQQRLRWSPSLLQRLALIFITTTATAAAVQHLHAQEVSSTAPPATAAQNVTGEAGSLPDLPRAVPVVPAEQGDALSLEFARSERHGDLYRMEGGASGPVVITFRNHVLRADRLTYDAATGEVTAEGHLQVSGGDNDEYIQASRGNYNLNQQTGRFYDVQGSVGVHLSGRRTQYDSPNPFLFSGRMVVKTGPEDYDVYDGKVTSCLMPHPDWILSSQHFSLDGQKARARNSTFRLLEMPILFLPYVTHPIDAEDRQSGFLIPVISQSSTKGTIIGESVYLVLGRSADLTVGSEYYSSRGFSEAATFRYRGAANDFLSVHFSSLQDRGYYDSNHFLIDQGGQDVTAAFRKRLTAKTRLVGDAEYLSSYVYREAFNDSFNQAVSSDITSVVYAVNQQHGFSTALRTDRYQGLKRVPIITRGAGKTLVSLPGQQVRIFHAPSLDFTALDHRLAGTPLVWSVTSSIAGLKRTQPNFVSSGIIERVDVRPELSLPLSGGGWHMMSSLAVRETFYSRSRQAPYPANAAPIELTTPTNRASLEAQADIRPPAIERTFQVTPRLRRFLGTEVRHTIEPEVVYRNVRGIDNFLSILRFDEADVDTNTNELEYGATQRLFGRPKPETAPRPCIDVAATARPGSAVPVPQTATSQPPVSPAGQVEAASEPESAGSIDANGIPVPDTAPPPTRTHVGANSVRCEPQEAPQREWMSWRVTQKHFFDPTFGNAVINNRRNIFSTTLALSGVAFLTEGRDTSPLISRFRMRTSSHTDIEWDFDLDTGAHKFTSSNVFLDAHEGPLFGAISYARLNAPGRFYTETIDDNGVGKLTASATSDFSQMRILLGYGTPTKPGLSAAGNANLDLRLGGLQYGAFQTSYNWNCCGLSMEYRKYELGSVRNEGAFRFSFTLANIGTAGNLRRAQRLF